MKNNVLKAAIKLFGSYCIACVMALIMGMALMLTVSSPLTRVIIQTISCTIMFYVIYTTAWKIGNKDRNSVNYGHTTYDSKLGFKLGLILMAVIDLTYVFLLISRVSGVSENLSMLVVRIFNAPFLVVLNSLMPISQTISETPLINILICSSLLLSIPIIIGCAYIFGYHDFYAFKRFIYNKNKASS